MNYTELHMQENVLSSKNCKQAPSRKLQQYDIAAKLYCTMYTQMQDIYLSTYGEKDICMLKHEQINPTRRDRTSTINS